MSDSRNIRRKPAGSTSRHPIASKTLTWSTEWSEENIRALLSQHEFTYQSVRLPYGLTTSGTDRSSTARLIFPESLTDKSVFDVGCMYGYFVFEAEERGAENCVGGEVDPANLGKCQLLASARGSRAQFLRLDIERDEIPGIFDYVLCLNVLHHLRNPLAVLEKLIACTRECLVLEVASLTSHDSRKLGLSAVLGSHLMALLPILYLGGAGKAKGAGQTFFFTESAIYTLLKKHRQDFASVEFKRGGQKGRFIVVARKRRIGHLYIIAGVNAVGKSTFLGNLANGKNLDIAEEIGLDLKQPWSLKHYGGLARETEVETPYLLLHYNISQHVHDGDVHRYDRGLLDIIRCAEKTTITTFWHPPEKLFDRYKSERVKSTAGFRSRRIRRKTKRLLELYGNNARFTAIYGEWFEFAKQYGESKHVVLQEPDYRVISIDAWEAEFGSG